MGGKLPRAAGELRANHLIGCARAISRAHNQCTIAFLTALLLALAAAPAAAQEQAIPETIVTATRVPTLADQIAAGVTVIDRATIKSRGYTTLVDALSAVPGLRVVQSGGPGAPASVFIRGANSNQTLVLLNGVPINDPSGPGGAFDFGLDTLGDVSRIEVVRGPMSSLYGSGAIGGVINIITVPGTGSPHVAVNLAGGLPAANKEDVSLSGASGAFDYSLGVGALVEKGFDATPRRESVYTGERDGFRTHYGNFDFGWTIVPGTRLSLLGQVRDSVEGLDITGFPAFDAPNYVGRDDSAFGSLALDSQVTSWWHATAALSGLHVHRHFIDPLDPLDPNQESNDDLYRGGRIDFQENNDITIPDRGPFRDSTLTLGYERTEDLANVALNDSFFGVPFEQETHAAQQRSAWHAGIQSTLWRRLTFTGGLREDQVSGVGDAFTWRGGVVLAVPEIRSRFKLSGGTAFLAPSLFDLFGAGSGYVGNPNLKPERSIGFEVGWSGDIAAFGKHSFATLGVTYFHTSVTDLIQTVFTPVFTSVNIGAANLQGVETTLSLHPASWLSADLAYTFTDARDASTGQLLLRRPLSQFSANLRIRPLPRLLIAPEVLYVGPFEDDLVNNAGFPAGTGLAASGVIVNVTTTYQLEPHLALYLSGYNIFNSTFEPASGFAYPGASFLAGVRANF